MATAEMDTVIWHLRRAVLRQDGAGWTDGQLLASFIDHKDEAAFEALVHRHGPMVFGVCRRVVGNQHDAEDAFQATFLVLARKSSSVRPRERLANWLHGVALRTAMKAKTMTAKRRGREKQVTAMPEPEAPQQGQWRDLQPLLDQELSGLPENYRLPILLCDLEGKRIKEAAQQLGWPQGTLAGRLARGRKLLAKRLASRGVVLSAGSVATAVSQNVASAGVPISLMSSTVKAATMFAAGQATVAEMVPAKVAALTEGVLKAMLLTKLKASVQVLLVLATLGGSAGVIWHTQAAQPSDTQQAQQKSPKERFEEPALQGTWLIESLEEDGKPSPDEKAITDVVVTGDKITFNSSDPDKAATLTFKVDPSKKPKRMDITSIGEANSMPGIYEVSGDTLKLCWRENGQGGERPVTFTGKGQAMRLAVLKRKPTEPPKGTATKTPKVLLPPPVGVPDFLVLQIRDNDAAGDELLAGKRFRLVGMMVGVRRFKGADHYSVVLADGGSTTEADMWAKSLYFKFPLDARNELANLETSSTLTIEGVYDGRNTEGGKQVITFSDCKIVAVKEPMRATTPPDVVPSEPQNNLPTIKGIPGPAETGKVTGPPVGTWRVLDIIDGPASARDGTTVQITGKHLVVTGGEKKEEYLIVGINPTQGPAAIDLRAGGRTYRGIYQQEGKRLRLCVQLWTEGSAKTSVRPQSFKEADRATVLGPTLYLLEQK
jgi:RNA polymerase sigma factor (sigma-70 family)